MVAQGILMDHVWLYDTTLRDGTQAEGISLSVEDKVKITQLLDQLGIDYIEGGWPGSNPKDVAYFERARDLELGHARITAFGSTCRVGSRPEDDANIQAMVNAHTPVIALVGKSWTLHVLDVLRASLEENLRIIRDSVTYLKACRKATPGAEVIYDAEHFFDGYKADAAYARATLQAALEGGAGHRTDRWGSASRLPQRSSWNPCAQRWRLGCGQLAGGCARRCSTRPGHNEWLWRTLR